MQRRSEDVGGPGSPFRTAVPRLAALVGSILAVSVALSLFLALSAARPPSPSGEDAYRQSMRIVVSLARNLLEPTLSQVRSGQLSLEAGLERARSVVRLFTYADATGVNYVFMLTYGGTVLVLPFEPSKEGTFQESLKDVRGIYITKVLLDTARKNPNGGFVSYYYDPPGKTVAEEKTSYVLDVPELGAVIGTGMFLSSADAPRRPLLPAVAAAASLAAILTVLAFVLLSKTLSGLASANAAERAKSDNLEGAFASLDSAFAAFSGSGACLWTNGAALRLLAPRAGAPVGASFVSLLGNGVAGTPDAGQFFERALAGEALHVELVLGGPDGKAVEAEAFIRRGSWNGGTAVVAEIRQIGEQRRLERALYARKAELDRFERLVVGRELRMIELKKRIAELEARIEDLSWKEGKGGGGG